MPPRLPAESLSSRVGAVAAALAALATLGGGLLVFMDQRIAYRIAPLETRITALKVRITALEAKTEERFRLVEHRLDALGDRLGRVEARLDRMEERFDSRFDQLLKAILAEGPEADKAKAALRADLRRRQARQPQGGEIKLGDGKGRAQTQAEG